MATNKDKSVTTAALADANIDQNVSADKLEVDKKTYMESSNKQYSVSSEQEGTKTESSAIEQIYDKLADVFGGTNPSQVLSMLMPGSSLNIDDFRYDTNKLKPVAVKEAESRLANQMFDIAKVQAGSNGQKVASQYMQALSVLVPKFNPLLPQVKNILRDYINMPAPDSSIDGQPFKGTLQDYYFRVYEKWLDEKAKWQDDCDKKRHEFYKQNPETAKEEYLEWFETNGEIRLGKISALFGKILSVYSPSDMDAILGALTSGPGGEIEETLNFVNSFRVMSASGGYIYPVDLSPSNWSQYLQSNIDPVNLLKDPEYVLQSINAKKQALKSCLAQLANIASKASTSEAIVKAKQEYETNSKVYDDAFLNLQNNYTDNTVLAVQMYLEKNNNKIPDAKTEEEKKKVVEDLDKEAKKASEAKRETNANEAVKAEKKNSAVFTFEDITKIKESFDKTTAAQNKLVAAGKSMVDASRSITAMETSVNADLSFFQSKFQSLLEELTLEEQLFIATLNSQKNKIELNAPTGEAKAVSNPDKADPFMTFQFSFTQSQIDTELSNVSDASASNTNVNFFFGGYSNSSSSSHSKVSNDSLSKDTEIKIAFKAAKVDISREWFNPGIFKLTKGMSRMSHEKISEGAMSLIDNEINWKDAYERNKCLFPSFPTAFIIAKDVVIEFKVAKTATKSVHEITDQKQSSGGGFFCFSAAKSSSNRKDESSLHSTSQGEYFRISIPAPQILAWYLQLLPADNSTIMDITAPVNTDAKNDVNIVQFVKAMRDFEKEKSQIVRVPRY